MIINLELLLLLTPKVETIIYTEKQLHTQKKTLYAKIDFICATHYLCNYLGHLAKRSFGPAVMWLSESDIWPNGHVALRSCGLHSQSDGRTVMWSRGHVAAKVGNVASIVSQMALLSYGPMVM